MEGPHVRPGEAGPMFVKKLWQIIRQEDHSIIDFTPDGAAFQVFDLKRLESEVLPKYFRHSRYQSFVRQLNLYGFNKTTRERHVWIYRHEYFHRDHPDWLDKLRRKGSEKSQRQSSPHGSSPPYADSGVLNPVGFTNTSPTSGAQYVMPDQGLEGHVAHAIGAACGGGGGGRGGDGHFEGFERVSPMGCGHVERFGDVGRETRGVDAGAAGSASAPRVMAHFDSRQPIGGYVSHGAGDSQWDHAHTQMSHRSVGYAEGQPHAFTQGRPAGGMTNSCTPSPHNPEISAPSSFCGGEGAPGGAFEGFSCELLHGAAYGSLSTASPHHGGPTHGMQATSLSIDSMLSYDVEDERMTRSASDMSNSTTDSAAVEQASGFMSSSPVGHTGSVHMQHGVPGFPPVPLPASVVGSGAHSISHPPASYHYPHHHQQHHQQQQHQHPPPPPPPPPRPQHHPHPHPHHPQQQQQQQQQQQAQAPFYSTTTFRTTDGTAFPLYENTLGLDHREGMHISTGNTSVNLHGFPGFSSMPTSVPSPHSFPVPAMVHRSSSCSSSTSCGGDVVLFGGGGSGGGSGDSGGGGYGGGGGSGFASSPAAAADVKPSAVGYWASIPPTGYQTSEPAFGASPSTSGSPTGMDAAQVRLPPTAPRIPAHGEGDLGGQWAYLQHLCTRHADVLSSAQLPRGLEELLVFCVRTNPFNDRHDLQHRLQCALERSLSLNHDMQVYRSGMMSSSSSPTTEPPLLHVFFGNLATGLTRAREMCRGRGGPILEVIDACARVWMGVSSSYL